ncbi:MAG: hypothetical protein QM726_06945 [Chitinophagaceae bacterium]
MPAIKIRTITIIASCIIIVFSCFKSAGLLRAYGSVDLRCRIVGVRISGTQNSPYFYKWHEKDSLIFLDPNDRLGRKVNGNVVTPAVLKFFFPLSHLSYKSIQTIWAFLQYFFLLSSLFLTGILNRITEYKKSIKVLLIAIFYLCSNIWFYNIERGQIYTFYLFSFSLIYYFSSVDWKFGKFLAGCINTFTFFLRPLVIVFLFSGIYQRSKMWMAGCICGGIVGLLFFVLPVVTQWNDYFSAMKEYSYEITGKTSQMDEVRQVPDIIEGVDNLQKSMGFQCGGLSTVQYYLAAKRICKNIDSVELIIGYCIIAGLFCFLYFKKALYTLDKDHVFLFSFFLYILAELFIIGYRGGYNQVEWLFGISLLCKRKYLPTTLLIVVAIALTLENIYLNIFRFQFELAEITLLAVLLYVIFVKSDDADFKHGSVMNFQ